MAVGEEQIKRIHDKLQSLVKQHAAMQKENIQLREQLTRAQDEANTHQQNIDALKQQVNVLRLNAGEMSETDKKEIEKKINGYLKEIDRCIAMLGE
jgi:chromosome segregation ATPase